VESPRENAPAAWAPSANPASSVDPASHTVAAPDPALARFEQIVADVSRRLAKTCSHMSEAEFKALVMNIVLMKVRFDEVESAHWRPMIDHITAIRSNRVPAPHDGGAQ
jgi:hypothetical protein